MRDRTLGDTFYMMFTTRAFASGIPTTLAGTPVVSAYEDNSATQITAGITLGVDHDGVTGLNLLTIVATGGNGFETGKDYNLVITTGTVGGVSVVGEVVGEFSLDLSAALKAVDLLNDVAATDIVSAGAITTLSGAVVNVDLVDTLTTYTGNTPQTADVAARVPNVLNTTALGNIGIDWGNVENPATSVTFSSTTVNTATNVANGVSLNASATSAQLVDDVWDEVLTGATHNVANSSGRRLRALQEFKGYESGAIWIDTINGVAGTTDYENGTVGNPVDTITDANTLSSSLGLNRFEISPSSSIAFAASQENQVFKGHQWNLALGGQPIAGSYFYQSKGVSGISSSSNGNPFGFQECQINTAEVGCFGSFEACSFSDTLTIGSTSGIAADAMDIFNCFSNVAGGGSPVITAASVTKATSLNVRNWFGGATWIFTSDCTASIEAVLGGTHTITTGGGDIEFRGAPKALVVNQSAGGTTNVVLTSNCPVTITGAGGTVNIYGFFDDLTVSGATGGTINLFGFHGVAGSSGGATVNDNGQDYAALGGGSDWSTSEREEIRGRLGMTGATAAGGNTPTLSTQASVDALDTKIGTPVAASVSADIAVIDGVTDSILLDTGTTLPGLINNLAITKNQPFNNFEFLMQLASDGRTPAVGLTVTGQRSIDGGAFTAVSGSISEVSNGIYQFDALAADTNGDVITWRFSAATADDTFVTFQTVS